MAQPANRTRSKKRLALIVVEIAALLAVATAAAFASTDSWSAHATGSVRATSDTLEITDSRSGGAILATNSMAPGRSVTGDVTITNTGSLRSSLALSKSDLVDVEGPNGGQLSDALNLSVRDNAGTTYYAGKLTTMGTVEVGTLEPGQSRIYVISATFPDGGAPLSPTTGDNAFMASSSSLGFTWTATELPPLPPPPPLPPTPPAPVDPPTQPTRLVLSLSGKGVQRLNSSRSVSFKASANLNAELSATGVVSKRLKRKKSRTLFKTKALKARVTAGRTTALRFKFNSKQARRIKNALKRHYPVYLTVSVKAHNSSTESSAQQQARIRMAR